MSSGVRLGRFHGIDVVADASLVVLAALLTWGLYLDLTVAVPDVSRGLATAIAVVGGGVFIGSIVVHELSHSVVAVRRGIGVRRIRLFIFGGLSEIEAEASTPRDELAIALAGPAASVAVGLVLLAAGLVLGDVLDAVARTMVVLGVANLILAAFNLVPGFPLDGGRVLRAALWGLRGDRRRATRVAITAGRIFGLVLIGGGLFLMVRFLSITGLWWIVIGWFLYRAAVASGQREAFTARVSGLTARDVMRPTSAAIPGSMSITQALDLYQMGPRLRTHPVEVAGRIRGVIGETEISDLSPARLGTLRVSSVMVEIGPEDVVEADAALESLLSRPAGASGRVVVVDDGRVVGLITGEEMRAVFDG